MKVLKLKIRIFIKDVCIYILKRLQGISYLIVAIDIEEIEQHNSVESVKQALKYLSVLIWIDKQFSKLFNLVAWIGKRV